jgi:hypothetical protein
MSGTYLCFGKFLRRNEIERDTNSHIINTCGDSGRLGNFLAVSLFADLVMNQK